MRVIKCKQCNLGGQWSKTVGYRHWKVTTSKEGKTLSWIVKYTTGDINESNSNAQRNNHFFKHVLRFIRYFKREGIIKNSEMQDNLRLPCSMSFYDWITKHMSAYV